MKLSTGSIATWARIRWKRGFPRHRSNAVLILSYKPHRMTADILSLPYRIPRRVFKCELKGKENERDTIHAGTVRAVSG